MPDQLDEPNVQRANVPAPQAHVKAPTDPVLADVERTPETALRESEARYRRLVESAPAIVYTFSTTRGSLYFSPYVEHMLGYSVEYLYTHPLLWNESIHPDDRDRIEVIIREFEQEKSYDIEYRLRDAQGNWHWLRDRFSGQPVDDAEVLIEGLAIDITDLKLAEEVLRASKQRAQAMLRAIPDLMFRLDRNGVFLDYQADIQDLYAQSAPSVIGQRNRDISPPGFADLIDRQIQITLETGALQTFEYQLPIPGRGLRDYEARMVPCGADEVTAIVRDVTDRKRVETQYRDIFENAIEGIFQSTPDGRFLSVNAAMARIFGYDTPAEMIAAIGHDIPTRIHVHLEQRAEFVRRLTQTGEVKEFEAENYRKDGNIIWTRTSARVIRDADGNTLYYEGFLEDITERKRAESQRETALEALRVSEERFRLLAETIQEVFWMADVDLQRTVYISPSYAQVWGRSCQSLYDNPRSFLDAIHPDDRACVLADLEAEKIGRPFDHEYRIIQPDGTLRWIWDRGFPIVSETAPAAFYVGSARDITDRKQAESQREAALQALQHSEERFRTIFEQAPLGMALVDSLTGQILEVNARYIEIFGGTREYLTHSDWMSITHPDDLQADLDQMARLNAGEITGFSMEKRCFRADGTLFWINLTVAAISRGDPRQARHLTMVEDITARKQTEEALRASQHFIESVVNTTPDIVYIYDLEARRNVYSSREIVRALGYSPEQVQQLGDRMFEVLLYPDDAARVVEHHRQLAFLQDDVAEIEYRMKHANGQWRWLHSRERAFLRNDNGTVRQIIGTASDIAAHKQAEEALKTEYNFRIAIENSMQAGVAAIDLEGRQSAVNPHFSSMVGWPAEELIGRSAPFVYWPDDELENINRAFQLTLQGQVPDAGFELKFRRRTGEIFDVLVSLSALKNSNNDLIGWLAVVTDNTERKRAEQAILESEKRFRDLFENAPLAIFQTTLDGRIVTVNPVCAHMFGYPSPEAMCATVSHVATDLFVDSQRWPEMMRLQADNLALQTFESLYRRKDGSTFLGRLKVSTITDAGGRMSFFEGFIEDITEFRRAEEALRQREQEYKTLVENTPDVIARFDRQYRHLYVNPVVEKEFGSAPSVLLGKTHRELGQPPEMADWSESIIRQVFETGQEVTFELSSGDQTYLARGVPEFAEDGSIMSALFIHHNITNRKHIEAAERAQRFLAEALRDTAAALNSTLDFDAVLDRILDIVGRVVPHDSAHIILLDDTRQIGRVVRHHNTREFDNASAALTTQFSIAHTRNLREMRETGAAVIVVDTLTYDGWVRTASGAWIRSSLGVPILIKGETIGFLALNSAAPQSFTAQDADHLRSFVDQAAIAIENARLHERIEEHAAELEQRVAARTAELAAERNRVQLILDAAGDGICFLDQQLRVQYLNPALVKISGYAPSVALGRRPRDLWRSDLTAPAVLADLDRCVAQGLEWHGEVINRRQDGSYYDAALTLTPLRDAAGELTGFVVVHSDISRLKELERLKDQFVTRIGHELRTPLMSLFLYLDLLEHGKPEKRDQYLQTLRLEADRLRRLVEGFLRLAELEAQAASLAAASIDLNVMVADLAIDRHKAIEQRELALDVQINSAQHVLATDAALLYEALSRVLDNAINYTPRGGHISVATGQQTEDDLLWYTLTVRDTGPGFSPADLPHLFERFYRGSAAQDYKTPGVGLGLAICKAIMKRLDGRITVESQPGQGATFVLWLRPDFRGS